MEGKNIKALITLIGLGVAILLLAVAGNAVRTFFTRASSTDTGPSSLPTAVVTTNTAIISWNSVKPSIGTLIGGTTPTSTSILSGGIETSETSNHKITLSFLLPNTTYYYRIKVGDKAYPPETEQPYSLATEGSKTPAPTPMACGSFEEFMTRCSPNKRECDFNNDKSVNATDFLLCLRQQPG